ncbi:MAG: peptidylprolyl isomerase [Taibaiella sp.]|nr:peptidylprolyl isomerase [Taibaiella sp.]
MKKILLAAGAVAVMTNGAFAQKNKVKIETEYGNIVVMLYDMTPKNTENMVKLAREHVYDSLLFHRCIPQFMIQGGDPDSKNAKPGQTLGNGGLKYTVPAEISDSLFHKKGALAVARDNNPDKSGSSSQFYLVVGKTYTDDELDKITARTGRKFTATQREAYKTVGGTPFLDGNYTVFGQVLEGQDIVDKISMEPRDGSDRPKKDMRIIKLRVMKKKKKFLFF